MTASELTEEHLLVFCILSLVLYHSTQGALVETAKFILLNPSLASVMQGTFDALCSTGSASVEHEDEACTDHAVVFLLLFCHFYLQR